MINQLVESTNNYSVEKKGASINVTYNEMLKYLGILIHMGIVTMPAYQMYWATETRYSPIADTMTKNRFEAIKFFFHIADNTELPRNRPHGDKLFKVRPLYDHVLKNCKKIPPGEYHSIDEQMIPYKGKTSSMRQYNPKKTTKWGYKCLTRCSEFGLIYNFFLYTGADTFNDWLAEPFVEPELVQVEVDNEESIQNEPIQNEPIQNEPIQNEPIQNEPIRNESIQNQSIQNQSIQNHSNNEIDQFLAINRSLLNALTNNVQYHSPPNLGNHLNLTELTNVQQAREDEFNNTTTEANFQLIEASVTGSSTPKQTKKRVSFKLNEVLEELQKSPLDHDADDEDDDWEFSVIENRRPSANISSSNTQRSSITITKDASLINNSTTITKRITRSTANISTNRTQAASSVSSTGEIRTKKDVYKNKSVSMLSVLRLIESLPDKKNFKIFFDNWFSSPQLAMDLLDKGFHSVSTIRLNRIDAEFVTSTKEFEKQTRGSAEMLVNNENTIAVVRWLDTKAVHLMSSYVGLEPFFEVRRWLKAEGEESKISAPAIVKVQNSISYNFYFYFHLNLTC
jgi:hypothetical protein